MRGADPRFLYYSTPSIPSTPACAGLTPYSYRSYFYVRLYPRMRGADP